MISHFSVLVFVWWPRMWYTLHDKFPDIKLPPSYRCLLQSSFQFISSHIWGRRSEKQVSQAWISNCIPQYTVGCNYLSLPEIPASGTKVLIWKVFNYSNFIWVNKRLIFWVLHCFVYFQFDTLRKTSELHIIFSLRSKTMQSAVSPLWKNVIWMPLNLSNLKKNVLHLGYSDTFPLNFKQYYMETFF